MTIPESPVARPSRIPEEQLGPRIEVYQKSAVHTVFDQSQRLPGSATVVQGSLDRQIPLGGQGPILTQRAVRRRR